MKARLLEITRPRALSIREVEVPEPAADELLVRTLVSAISAGTELLFYRGDIAEGTRLDETLPSLDAELRYPVSYGYASVGEVIGAGTSVSRALVGRRVFGFAPHRSHFVVREPDAFVLPEDADFERAAFLPTAETAVNVLLDAAPRIGERVLVVGQGIVGLMTTALLARFPLERLWTLEPLEHRRVVSARFGAARALSPEELEADDFDLSVELSGTARGLEAAIGAMGLEGRVVVASWYGDGREAVALGTRFHRRRLRLVSSQVSRLGSVHLARWSKKRRLETAWSALSRLPVEALITHRIALDEAAEAYRLLDEHPEACLQVLLTYT
ncbi:MAG TPA: oxidoreductase [Vicinamibacteria bacterium]|nr:oxidoreductase [Vicinamibacteria bacterium]